MGSIIGKLTGAKTARDAGPMPAPVAEEDTVPLMADAVSGASGSMGAEGEGGGDTANGSEDGGGGPEARPSPPLRGPPNIKRAHTETKRRTPAGGPLRLPTGGRAYMNYGFESRSPRRRLHLDSEPPTGGAGEEGLEGGKATGAKRPRLAKLGR